MFNYVNVNTSLGNYSEEMMDILLELYNKIKEKFQFINKNTEVLVIDNTLNNADLMLDSLNKLADVLEMNPLFEDEYYLSLSIISYVEFIMADEDLLKQSNIFLTNIVINFFNLISDKQDMLLSNKNIDYKLEYNEFLVFYNDQKKYFHTYIYNSKNNDQDTAIDKVTNILWWLQLKTYF